MHRAAELFGARSCTIPDSGIEHCREKYRCVDIIGLRFTSLRLGDTNTRKLAGSIDGGLVGGDVTQRVGGRSERHMAKTSRGLDKGIVSADRLYRSNEVDREYPVEPRGR